MASQCALVPSFSGFKPNQKSRDLCSNQSILYLVPHFVSNSNQPDGSGCSRAGYNSGTIPLLFAPQYLICRVVLSLYQWWRTWCDRWGRPTLLVFFEKCHHSCCKVCDPANTWAPAAQNSWVVTVCVITSVSSLVKKLQQGGSASPVAPAPHVSSLLCTKVVV